MNLVVAGELGRRFRGSTDAAAYRDSLRRHQNVERDRQERRAELDADLSADVLDTTLAMAVTAIEVEEFRGELESYQTATVVALQRNERELEFVRARIDELLSQAHVLPDGRRVFKTKDGLRVFDEHGTELKAETIDPEMIDDARPYWETYKPEWERRNELEEERRALIDFQEKLDAASTRLDSGEITRDEFDTLRDQLHDDMPASVRAQFPGMDEPSADALPTQAKELQFSDDMIPSSDIGAPAPG